MTRTLLIAAMLGLSVPGAYACSSAKADTQTTASLDDKAMSTRDAATTGSVSTSSKPADAE